MLVKRPKEARHLRLPLQTALRPAAAPRERPPAAHRRERFRM